jgi:general stress protein 26
MKWAEIAAHEPALGAVAYERLIKPGVVLIGTTRRDGPARISGVEPMIMAGELWLSMMHGSAKVADLDRDPRMQVHSIISGPEAAIEIKLRGTARREHDREVQERYASKVRAELPRPVRQVLSAVQ